MSEVFASNPPSGETAAHQHLKQLAVAWALAHGYMAVATEVRLPRSSFRADVVGYRRQRGTTGLGETAVFECKQSRSDFLKDSHSRTAVLTKLAELDQRRRRLEQLLRLHYPSLRKGESLFAEYDAVDTTALEHRGYIRLLREIARWQRRRFGSAKFDRLVRYRCANLNYLVLEPDLLTPPEWPVGWGILIREDDRLVLAQRALWQPVAEADRLWLLERIARAATRLCRCASPTG